MPTKTVKPKNKNYGIVQRGTSLTIPVRIKDQQDKPLNLMGCRIFFTAKRQPNDFDYADVRAYISKDFEPQEPEKGIFYIQLSSQDLDFEVGNYYFDIIVKNPTDGMVYRLCTLEFTLEGGPTNRTVNSGMGQLPIGEEIIVTTLDKGNPIVVVAPVIGFEPDIKTKLQSILDKLDSHENRILMLRDELEVVKAQIEYIKTKI